MKKDICKYIPVIFKFQIKTEETIFCDGGTMTNLVKTGKTKCHRQ